VEHTSSPPSALSHPLLTRLDPSANPGVCAQILGNALPLRHLEALTPAARWWHRDGCLCLSRLRVAASVGSPVQWDCNGHPLHWLTLVHDGHATVKQGPQIHSLGAGEGVIVTGQPWTLQGQESSITSIGFDPLLVIAAARAMAPLQWLPPPPSETPLRRVVSLPTRADGTCAALVRALELTLPTAHELAQLGDGCLERFLIVSQMYRLLAAIVFADLRTEPHLEDDSSDNGDRRLDRVLDYISLHLHEPLPLSVLEAQSNYSRRSLHYAFQKRFGCSPMRWIRQQRMELALDRLRHPRPGDSVAVVASEFGYRSPSRFRVDFERTYGCKPSAVMRGLDPRIGSSGADAMDP
jgi:AraC-like DNA-binding protein